MSPPPVNRPATRCESYDSQRVFRSGNVLSVLKTDNIYRKENARFRGRFQYTLYVYYAAVLEPFATFGGTFTSSRTGTAVKLPSAETVTFQRFSGDSYSAKTSRGTASR